MAADKGGLISCVFCDFCLSDANYKEHLQVWHKVTVDLEEDARRVLGLPGNILNIRAVKDELLGDVGDELGSSSLSFAATSIQEPVREETARGSRRDSVEDTHRESKYDVKEEEDVVNLVEAIGEAAVEEGRKGKESKVKVMLLLRQCLASMRGLQRNGSSNNNMASVQRCGLEESKARVKKWCHELRETKREKWCEECCVHISAPNFKRHRRLMHSKEKCAMCPVPECGKNFYHNRYLEDHLRSAHGYDNVQCAEKFLKGQSVQLETGTKVKVEDCPEEMVLGMMKPRFKCDECDLTFATGCLTPHKKAVHRGVKNAKCPEAGCGKKYRYKSQLKDHMRAVHNYEKLECPRCLAKFLSHSGHTDHLARCTGPKSGHLSCMFPNCTEKLTSVKQLKLHLKGGHSSNSEFACDVQGCSRTYDRQSRLKRHKEKVHTQVKFDAEYQEARQSSPKIKNEDIVEDIMEEDDARGILKGGDLKNEHDTELSEEENVGAIQKWLDENSKGSGTMAGRNVGEVEVQELSMEIF